VNLYSLTDLLELHSGDLFDILKKTRDRWTAHFKKCDLCLAKRQLCIICDDAPFYPWQKNLHTCSACGHYFHKTCYSRVKECPHCARIAKRRLQQKAEP